MDRRHIDWEQLDKRKFFTVGVGLFSSITVVLYPLSVVKTRMMALDHAQGEAHHGLRGALQTARALVAADGPRGLWRGFGTVVGGMIPARMIYLYTLEATRGAGAHALEALRVPDTAAAATSSFLGGGVASLASQLVVVPIDVVSQRQMIHGGAAVQAAGAGGGGGSVGLAAPAAAALPTGRVSGLALAQRIVRSEGVLGLYRGFWASAATFVPQSACWWASYGAWQSVIWHQIDRWRSRSSSGSASSSSSSSVLQQQRFAVGLPSPRRGDGEVAAVQAVAGVLTGCTTAVITNPLDVAKTRLQTMEAAAGGAKPTWISVVRQLYASDGLAGFYRGVQPRMVSSAIWGTAMVSAYELLKRICALPPTTDSAA